MGELPTTCDSLRSLSHYFVNSCNNGSFISFPLAENVLISTENGYFSCWQFNFAI